MEFSVAESRIGYCFKDKDLLERALTLPSANIGKNNQTLEFFGDSILEFLVSEHIFANGRDEGELTELRKLYVSDSALRPVSEQLGLDKLLIRGAGDTANKKAVPSAYEAVLAAIYLDGGMEEARKFVLRTINFNVVRRDRNYKGDLQERLQAIGMTPPEYISESTGTPSSPYFRARVMVNGKYYFGEASKKQEAEQLAARSALDGFPPSKRK